jgi:hypothetical protein
MKAVVQAEGTEHTLATSMKLCWERGRVASAGEVGRDPTDISWRAEDLSVEDAEGARKGGEQYPAILQYVVEQKGGVETILDAARVGGTLQANASTLQGNASTLQGHVITGLSPSAAYSFRICAINTVSVRSKIYV